MIICTNNIDCYNYLQSKAVDVVFYETPLRTCKNIFFPKTFDISICGNRYNTQRRLYGEMKQQFENLKMLVERDDTIVITPMTLFSGSYHKRYFPESVSDVKGQKIHTKELGEIVFPHYIKIFGARLEPITNDEPVRDYVYYGKDNKEETLYWNAFYKHAPKEERRKKRYVPEYALFSQLYKQIILPMQNMN